MHMKWQEVIKAKKNHYKPPLCLYSSGLATSGISVKAVSKGHMIANIIFTVILLSLVLPINQSYWGTV